MNEGLFLEVVHIRSQTGFCFGLEAKRVQGLYPYNSDVASLNFEQWLGLPVPQAPSAPRYSLRVKNWANQQPDVLYLHTSAEVELRSLPASSIYPLPGLVQQLCQIKSLRAVAVLPEGQAWVWLLA